MVTGLTFVVVTVALLFVVSFSIPELVRQTQMNNCSTNT
jgi:hypothetical protein